MIKKRFKHKWNMLGMQFICYDDKEVLLGTFADKEGVEHIVDVLNELNNENKQLKNKLQTYQKGNSLLKTTLNNYKTENQQIIDTITEMYNNERTYIGKSVLKQVIEAIQ